MVTRELIHSEIERLSNDELAELYMAIQQMTRVRRKAKSKKSLMARLKSVSIFAPEDFAANHDHYFTGERRA